MRVFNNIGANLVLAELNKNDKNLSKDLKKITSGQRITGAKDGASDYAISEDMRVKIRALGQDVKNVQNGCALLKTAMGGVDNIIDELRTLKELALNSCNDHNTDVDREILQKEFDARKIHIDDVAIETNYNKIPLLDGTWTRYKISKEWEYITNTITEIHTEEVEGLEPIIIHNGVTQITESGLYEFAPDYTGTLTVSAKEVQLNGPKSGATLEDVYIRDNGVEDLYIKNLKIDDDGNDTSDTPSVIGFNSSSNNKLHLLGANVITRYDWDYDSAVINAGGALEIVGTGSIDIGFNTMQKGAIIGTDYLNGVCGDIDIGNGVTINIHNNGYMAAMGAGIGGGMFSSCGNISIGTGAIVDIDVSGSYTSTDAPAIGFMGSGGNIVIYSGAKVNVKAGSGAGIGTGEHNGVCGNITVYSDAEVTISSKEGAGIGTGSVNGYRNSDGHFINTVGDITIYSYSSGKVVASTSDANAQNIGKGHVYNNNSTVSVKSINLLDEYNHTEGGTYDPFDMETGGQKIVRTKKTVYEEIEPETRPNPLIIHTGTKSNQNIPIYIEDMRLDALGIKNTLITPLENAKNSLDIIDSAIDYALDQATTLGAYYNELEFTQNNLTTAIENETASESVIRDADMAKEMTSYVKNNILSQTAGAMLAQANKNSGAALNLLQ